MAGGMCGWGGMCGRGAYVAVGCAWQGVVRGSGSMRDRYCDRSMSGRYASYWNAFLFILWQQWQRKGLKNSIFYCCHCCQNVNTTTCCHDTHISVAVTVMNGY